MKILSILRCLRKRKLTVPSSLIKLPEQIRQLQTLTKEKGKLPYLLWGLFSIGWVVFNILWAFLVCCSMSNHQMIPSFSSYGQPPSFSKGCAIAAAIAPASPTSMCLSSILWLSMALRGQAFFAEEQEEFAVRSLGFAAYKLLQLWNCMVLVPKKCCCRLHLWKYSQIFPSLGSLVGQVNHVSGVQVVLKSCEYPGDSGDISLQVFYGFLGKTGKRWLRNG